jgi:hypothetical protein
MPATANEPQMKAAHLAECAAERFKAATQTQVADERLVATLLEGWRGWNV